MLFLLLSAIPALQESEPEVRWEEHVATGPGGVQLVGRLGRFDVPLDRDDPESAMLELAFVHYPSRNPDPGPPIVYLAGGPGASGIDYCVGPAAGRTLALLDHADVIGLDQRGTGLSEPRFDEGPEFALELDPASAPTRDEQVAAYRDVLARAAAHWSEQGYALQHFDTTANADDVDALRRALGLEEVVLWGQSYGSHLGLEVLRRHPEGVARAVLAKVEGPDQTFKLPSTTQFYLEQLGELVRADPGVAEDLPDLVGTLRGLIEKLELSPVVVELAETAGPRTVRIGAEDVRTYVAECLGQAFRLRDLPAQIAAWAAGDWTSLTESALFYRRVEVWSPMAIAMDCASGASKSRWARIRRERKDPANLLRDAVNGPYPEFCAACSDCDVGSAFRSGAPCDVPVLFVSGTLDARTPPSNVAEILGHYRSGVHVVCENAGHEPIEVLSREFVELVRAFLAGETIESATIELPKPRFTQIDG